MKFDRKGDIGFMEAMAGAMTVCLVLTAFSAFLAADLLLEEPDYPEFDWTQIGSVTKSGNIVGMMQHSDIKQYIEDSGFKGVVLKTTYLVIDFPPSTFRYGGTSDTCFRETKAIEVTDEYGLCYPAIMEVTVYL